MSGRTALSCALALLLLAPASQAATQPVAYFLKDDIGAVPAPDPGPLPAPSPVAVPQLILAGGAVLDPYDPYAPNSPNDTRPHMRVVPPAGESVAPLEFLSPEGHDHPERLKGLILIGLYPGQSAVAKGDLVATLYEVPESGDRVELVRAAVTLDFNQSRLPNATSLMPPNSTDPTVIVYYELAQVLPAVLQPPAYFLLGPVDLNLTNGSRLALDVRLAQGSSPAPTPVGASATLQYESLYTPSFVVLPWFKPDPPRTTLTQTSTLGAGYGGGSSTGTVTVPDSAYGDGGKDTPGPGLALMAAALAAAAVLAARRRLK